MRHGLLHQDNNGQWILITQNFILFYWHIFSVVLCILARDVSKYLLYGDLLLFKSPGFSIHKFTVEI